MQAGDFAQAMQQMAAAVHQHYVRPEVSHHCLYYPGLDAQLVARDPAQRRHQAMIGLVEIYGHAVAELQGQVQALPAFRDLGLAHPAGDHRLDGTFRDVHHRFGSFGRRGLGYPVVQLKEEIQKILGLNLLRLYRQVWRG